MELNKTYNLNKNSLLLNNSNYIKDFKKKIIKNFDLSPKKIKNNESLKYFDKNFIRNIDYFYQNNNISKEQKENSSNDHTSLFIDNGYLSKIENGKINGIEIENLSDIPELAESKIRKYEKYFNEDYLVNINSVLMNSGLLLEFKSNLSKKIVINNNIFDKNLTVFSKNFFSIGDNSKITIIEIFNYDTLSNNNNVSFFELGKNSEVQHLILQNNSKLANLQLTTNINCMESSKFKQITFNTSSGLVRNHHYANLNEINSEAKLSGIFFGSGNQIIDNKTEINHFAPSCISDQKYKGILKENAKASYLSKTYVDQLAQKTEAYQLSKGILLSDSSYFNSKPELKIFADDVKCSHGSTIGPFDDELLFYCQSRGIPKNKAISLLINSFFSDIMEEINEKSFSFKANNFFNQWLKSNDYANV